MPSVSRLRGEVRDHRARAGRWRRNSRSRCPVLVGSSKRRVGGPAVRAPRPSCSSIAMWRRSFSARRRSASRVAGCRAAHHYDEPERAARRARRADPRTEGGRRQEDRPQPRPRATYPTGRRSSSAWRAQRVHDRGVADVRSEGPPPSLASARGPSPGNISSRFWSVATRTSDQRPASPPSPRGLGPRELRRAPRATPGSASRSREEEAIDESLGRRLGGSPITIAVTTPAQRLASPSSPNANRHHLDSGGHGDADDERRDGRDPRAGLDAKPSSAKVDGGDHRRSPAEGSSGTETRRSASSARPSRRTAAR